MDQDTDEDNFSLSAFSFSNFNLFDKGKNLPIINFIRGTLFSKEDDNCSEDSTVRKSSSVRQTKRSDKLEVASKFGTLKRKSESFDTETKVYECIPGNSSSESIEEVVIKPSDMKVKLFNDADFDTTAC